MMVRIAKSRAGNSWTRLLEVKKISISIIKDENKSKTKNNNNEKNQKQKNPRLRDV